ncbi:MAG: hypothetical protein CME82_06420 [Halomonas sp.]|mgnify:CR=1 FL=1|nr:hypothetical protein [Halomonas sp.]|tara:strand:- start:1111 stop:1413 length:303 start_codon:yes stop_codon:yes gene_type:complete
MKGWLTLAVAALLTGEVTAADHDACSVRSQLAEEIMWHRQAGTPIREVVDLTSQDGPSSPYITAMINMAYERQAARSEEYQKIQRTEFGNVFYLHCMQQE